MKPIVAMLCVTALIGWALYLGYNTWLLALGVAGISGLGGFALHDLPIFKRH